MVDFNRRLHTGRSQPNPALPMAPGGRYGWEGVAHGPMAPQVAAIHTYDRSHSHLSSIDVFALMDTLPTSPPEPLRSTRRACTDVFGIR